VGEPLAIIVGKDNKVKNPKVLYVSDNKDGSVHHSFNSLVVQEGEKFQPIPNTKKERSVLYVTGASGSGKSFYTANHVAEFKRISPKRDVYLLSSLSDDSSIDRIPNLKRIKLNEKFLNTELSAEDFTKSFVIFDDTDCITNKPMKL
jgi:Cdc6-like AAA superfamily ATPase